MNIETVKSLRRIALPQSSNFQLDRNHSFLLEPPSSSPFNIARTSDKKCDLPHFHNFMQLWWVRKGSYIHNISGNNYLQSAGSLVIIPPFTQHYIDTLSSPEIELFCLDFFPIAIANADDGDSPTFHASNVQGVIFRKNVLPLVSELSPENAQICSSLLENLLNKHNTAKAASLFGDFTEAIIRILELVPSAGKTRLSSSRLRSLNNYLLSITEISSRIIDSPDGALPLSQACDIAMMSKSLVYLAFKEVAGITYGDLCLRHRVRGALLDLVCSDISITEISEKRGFANRGHFSNTFTSLIGLSPAKFRSRSHEKQSSAKN